MDKILQSHPASFKNDYDLLLQHANAKKQEDAINEFMDTKVKTTYIIIDRLFKDCAFEREGWAAKVRK